MYGEDGEAYFRNFHKLREEEEEEEEEAEEQEF